jgi:hypothetical protein
LRSSNEHPSQRLRLEVVARVSEGKKAIKACYEDQSFEKKKSMLIDHNTLYFKLGRKS